MGGTAQWSCPTCRRVLVGNQSPRDLVGPTKEAPQTAFDCIILKCRMSWHVTQRSLASSRVGFVIALCVQKGDNSFLCYPLAKNFLPFIHFLGTSFCFCFGRSVGIVRILSGCWD